MEELKNKQDFINKRTEDLGKVFGMARQDLVLLIAVVSVILNIVLGWKIVTLAETLNSRRVDDLFLYMRTEGKPIIEQEVRKELEPIKEDVKTTTGEIKQSITDFKEKMQ